MTDEAAKKRNQRERMRREGYVLKQVWVRPEHWAQVKRFIERMVWDEYMRLRASENGSGEST